MGRIFCMLIFDFKHFPAMFIWKDGNQFGELCKVGFGLQFGVVMGLFWGCLHTATALIMLLLGLCVNGAIVDHKQVL